MEDLKQIIAANMTELRKEMNITQAELADQLGYTDKAVSKWERAESIPDVITLKQLADLFGVTLNYLVEANHPKKNNVPTRTQKNPCDRAAGCGSRMVYRHSVVHLSSDLRQ